MLADTDAGSVVAAAQSGKWRYSMLMLQVVLIPILYIVQELTVRTRGICRAVKASTRLAR